MFVETMITQLPIRRSILVEKKRYFLSFPELKFRITSYHGFSIKIANFKVHCVFQERLCNISFLPNFFGSSVCLGEQILLYFSSVKSLESYAVNQFWNSQFTLLENHPENHHDCECLAKKLGFKNIEEYLQHWQQKTKGNLSWIPDKTFFGFHDE